MMVMDGGGFLFYGLKGYVGNHHVGKMVMMKLEVSNDQFGKKIK